MRNRRRSGSNILERFYKNLEKYLSSPNNHCTADTCAGHFILTVVFDLPEIC